MHLTGSIQPPPAGTGALGLVGASLWTQGTVVPAFMLICSLDMVLLEVICSMGGPQDPVAALVEEALDAHQGGTLIAWRGDGNFPSDDALAGGGACKPGPVSATTGGAGVAPLWRDSSEAELLAPGARCSVGCPGSAPTEAATAGLGQSSSKPLSQPVPLSL